MKITASFLVFSFTLLQLSAAQPRRHHVHRRLMHERGVEERSPAQLTVTNNDGSAPTEKPEMVVYVDQNGNAVSTGTEDVKYVPATGAAEAAQPEPTVTAPAAEGSGTASEPSTGAGSAAPSDPSSSADPSSDPAFQGDSTFGVTYSPYKAGGGCKSASEVDQDFAVFAPHYGVVRLYGVDCDQVANCYAAAKKYGNKLMLGIFDISDVDSAVQTMASGVNKDWGIVEMVSVGNELVNSGQASAGQVMGAVSQARTALRGEGYTGPVTTVDTFNAVLANPELCTESDVCTMNCHPFFDPNTPAAQAGSFIANVVSEVKAKSGGKRVIVTETGWPWKGSANGAAVPSVSNQATALQSIRSAFSSDPGNLFFFTAFNDLWKQAAASTFYAEQYWGLGGANSPSDQ